MSKTQTVGTMSEWSGVIRDMFRQIDDGSLTLAQAQAFVEHRNPFAITDIRQEWQEFYRKYFRLTVDFSDVVIPENPNDFDRVIFIQKGLTFAVVVKAMRKRFKVYLYTEDLDKDVVNNVRVANKNYAVRVRERVEADEGLKDLSANQLKERGDNIITLLERFVYELKYFDETGEHLDISNWTLCAGSRRADGSVPGCGWGSGSDGLLVYWYDPDAQGGALRSRAAVS